MTIVAAWMSADTGVGPSIASGSQTWSGNWALLPIAPAKIRSEIARIRPWSSSPMRSMTSRMLSVPRLMKISMIPSAKPTSPTRLTMNAFLAASGRRALLLPEADQQVAREPDQLPGDEDDEEVVGQYQEQHREHEEVQVREEPPVPAVVGHVADRVDVDEQADGRHDDEQAGRQGVDEERRLDDEIAGRDPGEEEDLVAEAGFLVVERRTVGQGEERHDHAHRPDDDDDAHRDQVGPLTEPPADDGGDRETCQRQDRDEREEQVDHWRPITGSSRRIRRRAASSCSCRSR